MNSNGKPRNPRRAKIKAAVELPEALNQRLANYSLAAVAAGVGVLSCVGSAEAAPVCKHLTTILHYGSTFPLNPAEQQFAPFNIAQTTLQYSTGEGYGHFLWWNRGFLIPNSGGANALLAENNFPANLAGDSVIGPGKNFGKGNSYGLLFTYGKGIGGSQGHGTLIKHVGNFDLQQPNYLGFVFSQSGERHYGWVRLAVTLKKGPIGKFVSIHVQGYGYESTPNTPITAGSCGDEGQASATSPSTDASLGSLALGSVGKIDLGKP